MAKNGHQIYVLFILLDTFWLDIDHLDSNQPFTVDKKRFHRYNEFIENLQKDGLNRNVVIIEDPHLPYNKGHEIANDCINKNLTVKKSDSKVFVGACWPDDSVYPDFLNDECRLWWSTKVPLNVDQWNDMNEPSVFDTVENTNPRDNIHKCHLHRSDLISKSCIECIDVAYSNACNSSIYNDKDNIENDSYSFVHHKDVHNIYGHFHCLSTFIGVKERSKNIKENDHFVRENRKRPFVLTRSYFTGTSKHAAVWTGDQPSTLKDLQISFHQVCTASVCAMSCIGDPDKNLLELWFVNAVWFYPFLRLHGVLETLPRQELVASSDVIKIALTERYLFVPYWYTLFYSLHMNKNHKNEFPGLGVRFAFVDSPEIFGVYNDDYSCCELTNVGDSILVSPIYNFDSNTENFDFKNHNQKIIDFVKNKFVNLRKIIGKLMNQKKVFTSSFDSSLNEKLAPLFIKKGKIVPIFTNPSKSIAITRKNKISLIIALDQNKFAEGCLFLDDGKTFNFESGDFAYRNFVCKDGKIKNLNLNNNNQISKNDYNESFRNATIGSIVIIQDNEEFTVKENLDLKIIDDWEISLN